MEARQYFRVLFGNVVNVMVKCVHSYNVEMMKLGTTVMENHKMVFC